MQMRIPTASIDRYSNTSANSIGIGSSSNETRTIPTTAKEATATTTTKNPTTICTDSPGTTTTVVPEIVGNPVATVELATTKLVAVEAAVGTNNKKILLHTGVQRADTDVVAVAVDLQKGEREMVMETDPE